MKKTMTFLLIVALVFTMPFTSKATNINSAEEVELQGGAAYMNATDKKTFAKEKKNYMKQRSVKGKL